MLSNKFFKKVLIGALTVSMLAGTGITASAAVASPAPTFPSASPSNMVVPKEDLVNYINEKFPKEEAKELINKIYTSAFEALPEDTKQQVQQIIAVVSQEGFPEFMAQKFISDLVDTLYKGYLAAKDTAIATGKNKPKLLSRYRCFQWQYRNKQLNTLSLNHSCFIPTATLHIR